MKVFLINIICCSIMQVLVGVIATEGKMRKVTMSFVGLIMFYMVISSVVDILSTI